MFVTSVLGFMDLDDQTWLQIETTSRFLDPVVIISLPNIAGVYNEE